MNNKGLTTYAAMLRGINVNGKNMIKMPALVKTFEALSFEHVRTYVQSGNVVFEAGAQNKVKIEEKIQVQINKDFQADIPVIVLDADSLQVLRNDNPFLKRKDTDHSKLHMTFLSQEAGQELISKIDTAKYMPDEFIIERECIYLYCPDGYGKTKLTNNFFESKLKLTATTRNWNTVNKLIEMMVGE